MDNYSDNLNAIILIGESGRGLTYTYLAHDMQVDKHNLLDNERITIKAEYEFGFPEAKGIYKANIDIEYSIEYGTQTTVNSYELIHDLKL